MTTPAVPVVDPDERGRAALGTALGVVAPEAIRLRDGGVRLSGARDLIGADVLTRLAERLARRAADQASDDRILAEAVAQLGSELSRARGGSSPADGATAALDALLDVPDLPAQSRVEAEAMLRSVLEGTAETSESAAARLAALSAADRPPTATALRELARGISREAQVLRTDRSGATVPPGPIQTGSGRHRRIVGRHRQERGIATTSTRAVDGSGLVRDGRPGWTADLTEDAALDALDQVRPADLGGSITARPTVLTGPLQQQLAAFDTAEHGRHHVRVEIAAPPRGLVAQADLRSGTATDPHVLRISPRLDDAQLSRIWVNQLSQLQQQVAANRAGRPSGLIGRLRSALRGDGRNRAMTARYDEFRHLTRSWREAQAQTAAGNPPGPRSVAELEQDLRGLAGAIERRGGAAPELPWVQSSVAVPSIGTAGAVVAPVQAPPGTPAHLRERVDTAVRTLDAAIGDAQARVAAKTASAAVATEQAADATLRAGLAAAGNDRAAPERARRLLREASLAERKAQRHLDIAAGYQAAADTATEARTAYQNLGRELDSVIADPGRPNAQLRSLAEEAGGKVSDYGAALAQAKPRRDVLHSGAPTGRLPHLTALTEQINESLAAQNLPRRFTPELLHRTLRAEFRRVMSPDGLVLTVGGDAENDATDVPQLRLRLQPGELAEVLDPDVQLAESMVGQLEQGGHGVSATTSHNVGRTGSFSLKAALSAMPDPALQAVGQFAAPGFEFAFARSRSVNMASAEYALGGAVEDNRGESLLYRGPASWRLDVRASALDGWSPAGTVDSSGSRDADDLQVWVSHAYTVPPPARTIDISRFGEQRSTELPEHVATDVRGLNQLSDKTIRGTHLALGSLDRVGHDQLRNLLTEELPSRLDEATRPGGIGRLIYSEGRPVAYAQVETEVVWERVELAGDVSFEHWQERLRVGFSGATGNEAFGMNSAGSVTAGLPGASLSDLGDTTADLGPGARAGRSVSRSDSLSAGSTAIQPIVHRYIGPTQGYRARLKHKVTVHQIDGDGYFEARGSGTALLRIPENDAFRYGLPVDWAAVQRTDDGRPMLDKKGRILLRGDPQPSTHGKDASAWLGAGKGRLRGAGPGMPSGVTGADRAMAVVAPELSRQELLPPLDAELRPRLDALPRDPLLRASQLQNYERLGQHLNALRLKAGYDQAAQGGIPLVLVEHRTGQAARIRMFQTDLRQHFDQISSLGTTTSDAAVGLRIGSRTSTRSGGRSKRLPWSVSLGVSDKPGQGEAGSTPEAGGRYGRAALGRFFNWASGHTVNQVTLVESTGPLEEFDVPHTLAFREVTDAGHAAPLAEVEGRASVMIDVDLLSEPGAARATPFQGGTAEAVLGPSKVLHLDVGDPLHRLRAAAPGIAPLDSAAYHHLAAFLSTNSLISNPEWMGSSYRTRFVVSPPPSSLQDLRARGLLPQQASVTLTGTVSNHVFLHATNQVTGDINLTLGSSSATEGSSTGNTVGVSGGGGSIAANGDSAGLSGGGSRSASRARSRTDAQIQAWERLKIDVGQHYVFSADVGLTAQVTDGVSAQAREVKLDDGTVMFALPERDALRLYGQRKLDLPLEQVADAAERFLRGDLELDRRTATAVGRRYQAEKAGATEGLAATHSDESLAEKVRAVTGLGPSRAGSAAERVDDTFARAEEVAARSTEVTLPEHYRTMMGAALIEGTSLTNEAGDRLSVRAAVDTAIEHAAPGRLARDPVLQESLDGDLSDVDGRWKGHLDDMLSPRGFVKEYPVQTSQTGPPEMLVVRVRAVFDGPITTDGTPEGATESAAIIVQGYDYDEHGRARVRNTTYGGNLGIAGTDGVELSGSASMERSLAVSAASGEQSTRLQRIMHSQTSQVQRGMRLVVDVERLPVKGGFTSGWWRQAADRTRSQETGGAGHVELSGRLTQLVPKALINTRPTPPPARERQDHRTVTLPSSYFVEGTRPFLTGEPEADKLYDTVSQRLARPDMLGAAGVRMHRTELENQLSASVRSAAFERMTSDEGHALVPLPVPGHGGKVVDVQVRAVVSDLQLVGDPVDGVQLGEVDRIQRTATTSTTASHLLPGSGTVGVGAPGVGLKAGMTIGKQFSGTDSDTTGNRNELSKFEEGTVVTVRVRVDYDLTFQRRKQNRHGEERVHRSAELKGVAAGEAYLTMFHHQYVAMRERMESGAPLASALEGMSPQIAGRHRVASEFTPNAAGQQEHRPYQPLLDALAEARRDNVTVQVTMKEQSGQSRSYQARPDGTMRGTDDGGFGAAFATLDPRLVRLSEGRVDLRQLFNTSPPSARFTGAVSEALRHDGVPASVLAELDHTLARPAGVRVPNNGARKSFSSHTSSVGHGHSVS